MRTRTLWKGALLAGLTLLAACASNPPKPEQPPAAAETPEVPYQPKSPPPEEPKPAEAEAAKPTPAPEPAKAPEAPPVVVDPQSRAIFEQAVDAAMKHDVMTAERELRQLVDRNPRLDYAWTNLGVLYEREALPDQAERAYQKAIELKPDQETAWDDLARLYCRTGRASQIEGQLRSHIQQFPSALGLRSALVYTLLSERKFDVAANEAKKILKSDERNVHAMQLLAQVYYREGKNELAKMVLENAKAIDPNDAATLNALGLIDLSMKLKPQALEAFRKASEAKPDFAEAKNNYGALLNESQDYDTAAKVLEDAVNAAPDFPAARLNLGNAYRGKQDFTRALTQYKQVLRLKPDWPDVYFNLAIMHLDSDIPNMDAIERLNTAIAYFQQYREKGGTDDRIDQYIKDANKAIEKENHRRDREKKDQLRKAREQKEQEEAQRQRDAEAAQKAAAAQAEADRKAAAAQAEADRQAPEAARRARQQQQARPPPPATPAAPASRLGDDDSAPGPAPVPAPQPAPRPGSDKLGDGDK